MSRQQHFLHETEAYRRLLGSLSLIGREVFEIGVGHGELTQILLDAGVGHVYGVEIDPLLASPLWLDERVSIDLADFRAYTPPVTPTALVSNPPYDLLEEVLAFIDHHDIPDVVLMSPRQLSGYETAFTLTGEAFEPPSSGLHHVVVRGWKSNKIRHY